MTTYPPELRIALAIIRQAQIDARQGNDIYRANARAFFASPDYLNWLDLIATFIPELDLKHGPILPTGVKPIERLTVTPPKHCQSKRKTDILPSQSLI